MNSISLASSIAMAVGLAAALPQIIRMLRARSANGQSIVGWGMGLVANLAMAYVNFLGFHATFLAGSNMLSASLCVAAMALIARFGKPDAEAELAALTEAQHRAARDEARAARAAGRGGAAYGKAVPRSAFSTPGHDTLVDMPTMELVALRTALDEAHATRAGRREAAMQAA